MNKYLIYGLINPVNGDLFYIGRSSSGLLRPKHHFYSSVVNKSSYYVHRKIKCLWAKGVQPEIVIIETCDSEKELNAVERYYIKLYRDEGEHLCNLTDGGEGCPGRKVSLAVRQKLSNMYKGRKQSDEARIKQAQTMRGRKLTLEHKQKIQRNHPQRKPVECIQTGEKFNGIRQAARQHLCDHRGIARCCTGEYSQYKGLNWQYSV